MYIKYTIFFLSFLAYCISGINTATAQSIFISDIPVGFIANEFGPPNKDLSYEKNPITLDGKVFDKGLGVHAPSHILISLEGNALNLTAFIGIDSEISSRSASGASRAAEKFKRAFHLSQATQNPTARFIVKGDDKVLFSSGWMNSSSAPIPIEVKLESVNKLELIVENGPNGPRNTHADWADARLMLRDVNSRASYTLYYHPTELLMNHTGFLPASYKSFRNAEFLPSQEFSVLDLTDMIVVYTGKIKEFEGDWGRIGIGDFSSITQPGQYIILCGDKVSSPFNIHSLQYMKNLDVHLNWFLLQRCGDPNSGWEKGQHLDDGRRLDNDRHQNVSGGWHDAADLRKWGMTINGLWALSEVYLTLISQEIPSFGGKRNMILRIRDEIAWGNKYFHAMQEPDGFLMDQVGGDVYEHGDNNRFTDNIPGTADDRWIVTKPNAPVFQYMFVISQCNISLAEKLDAGNPYLLAAERCFRWITDNSSPSNIHELGAALTASMKLNEVTGKDSYLQLAEEYLQKLLRTQNVSHQPMSGFMGSLNAMSGESETFYPVTNLSYQLITPNFPVWSLVESIRYMKNPELNKKARDAFRNYVDSFIQFFDRKSTYGIVPMALYREDPGGSRKAGDYYYRWCYVNHEDNAWWNGINPRIGYIGASLVRGGMLIDHPEAIRIGQQQLDFIYGCNPFNASTVTGLGYNQPEFFKTSEFVPHTPKIEGAVMAGIGSSDEDLPVLLPEWWQTTEYWMEAVSATILLLNELNRYQFQSNLN